MTATVQERVAAGENLSQAEMAAVVDELMLGRWSDDQTVELLRALSQKGETVEEIAGAAAALRKHMTPIRSSRLGLLDTCGTGGDASGTFNISTAAALVAAAAGIPVAKHGNRSITSRSGSADVLAVLGVDIEAPVRTVERCLDELGIGFCFAPQLHPSMRHVAAARRKLGAPSLFNLLGPLCNPASAPYQLLGVGNPDLQHRLASALCRLGTRHAAVVSGEDGLDELTLSGPTRVIDVRGTDIRELRWWPEEFGIRAADLKSLTIDGPAASAAMIREILAGAAGPPRDIVVLNAAAAIWTADAEATLEASARRAAATIDSGAARDLLARLAELSHAR